MNVDSLFFYLSSLDWGRRGIDYDSNQPESAQRVDQCSLSVTMDEYQLHQHIFMQLLTLLYSMQYPYDIAFLFFF